MKKLLKVFGAALLAGVLVVVGLIAIIEYLHRRSQREVVAIVSQLAPGVPFSMAVQRLGRPTQMFTNADEIVWWVEKNGSRVEASVATNSFLHTFVHRGPPFRFVLVYSDRESQKVVHANWCGM